MKKYLICILITGFFSAAEPVSAQQVGQLPGNCRVVDQDDFGNPVVACQTDQGQTVLCNPSTTNGCAALFPGARQNQQAQRPPVSPHQNAAAQNAQPGGSTPMNAAGNTPQLSKSIR